MPVQVRRACRAGRRPVRGTRQKDLLPPRCFGAHFQCPVVSQNLYTRNDGSTQAGAISSVTINFHRKFPIATIKSVVQHRNSGYSKGALYIFCGNTFRCAARGEGLRSSRDWYDTQFDRVNSGSGLFGLQSQPSDDPQESVSDGELRPTRGLNFPPIRFCSILLQ